tara:strand:+ start:834 stop:1982 length:1149 start_codon:yes stop_codon:yes gene_type:complete
MRFFNKKEEVLDVQLTQFGKSMLSIGKFRPDQYAFFDDDILYHTQYSGGSGSWGALDTGYDEDQSETQKRIKETPRLKTQYVYHGVETDIGDNSKFTPFGGAAFSWPGALPFISGLLPVNQTQIQNFGWFGISGEVDAPEVSLMYSPQFKDKHYSLAPPLGTAERKSNLQSAPSWATTFLKGELSGSVSHLSSSNFPALQIPQLNTKIKWTTSYSHEYEWDDNDDGLDSLDHHVLQGPLPFAESEPDTIKALVVDKDYILLEIEEKNTEFFKENFDIEVFDVNWLDKEKNSYRLKQLYFGNVGEDDFYYQDETANMFPANFVDYYFYLTVDEEIDADVLCKYANNKSRAFYADGIIDCEEREEVEFEDIYNVTKEDVGEICE